MTTRILERAGALWLVLGGPHRLNPITAETIAALHELGDRAQSERPVAVVITGSGNAFTAGGDLTWFTELARERPDDLRAVFTDTAHALWKLEELPLPVISGVRGACVAGGMELVCFSDLVIAARSARFADGHAGVGLLPLAGSVTRMVARIGSAHASRLLLEGVFLDADEALRIGLVGQVVDDEQLDTALEATCAALAARPASALAQLLALSRPVDDARRLARQQELDAGLANITEPHVVAGLTAFLDRRRPQPEPAGPCHVRL